MSTLTATRTQRLHAQQPAGKATPRRTSPRGASVVGRADRPVLRIVAGDECPPIVTRVAPAPQTDPLVRSMPIEPGETRRVAVEEFFAAEYDGDEVGLQPARRAPSSMRLTRRGRLVVLGAGLLAALSLGVLAATASLADGKPEPTRVVTVQPGQTLWGIASQASARSGGSDVRSMMTHLEALNHLDSGGLQVGQTLRVPR